MTNIIDFSKKLDSKNNESLDKYHLDPRFYWGPNQNRLGIVDQLNLIEAIQFTHLTQLLSQNKSNELFHLTPLISLVKMMFTDIILPYGGVVVKVFINPKNDTINQFVVTVSRVCPIGSAIAEGEGVAVQADFNMQVRCVDLLQVPAGADFSLEQVVPEKNDYSLFDGGLLKRMCATMIHTANGHAGKCQYVKGDEGAGVVLSIPYTATESLTVSLLGGFKLKESV